jgi:hypothetical protein
MCPDWLERFVRHHGLVGGCNSFATAVNTLRAKDIPTSHQTDCPGWMLSGIVGLLTAIIVLLLN